MHQLKPILNPSFPGDSQNTLLPKLRTSKEANFGPSLYSLYAYALCFPPKWKKGTLAEFILETNYLEMIYPSTTEVNISLQIIL